MEKDNYEFSAKINVLKILKSLDEDEKEKLIKLLLAEFNKFISKVNTFFRSYCLDDLQEKLISYLYNLKSYETNDILLIYILFINANLKELDIGGI